MIQAVASIWVVSVDVFCSCVRDFYSRGLSDATYMCCVFVF